MDIIQSAGLGKLWPVLATKRKWKESGIHFKNAKKLKKCDAVFLGKNQCSAVKIKDSCKAETFTITHTEGNCDEHKADKA
jgi:hypothetical protein